MTESQRLRPAGFRLVRLGQPTIDHDFVFLLTAVDRSEAAGDSKPCRQAAEKGVFANAHLTMTNTGTEPKVSLVADQKLMVDGVAFKSLTVQRYLGGDQPAHRGSEWLRVGGAVVWCAGRNPNMGCIGAACLAHVAGCRRRVPTAK